jgi:enoyl-CoA hydratase/carnithine racemase
MPYATLRYDISDAGVATIALDQPDTRNALSNELLDELIAALEAARDDPAVHCVVLTSTHDRVFSAGANLGGFAGTPRWSRSTWAPRASRACSASSASSASRPSAPPTGTCWPGRSASRWPAT